MSEPSPIDKDLLISLYLDGDIDEQGLSELNAWLKEDRAHVAYFVDRVADHCRTSELVSGDFNLPFLAPEQEGVFQNISEAEDGLPTLQLAAADRLTKQQYASALSYVLRHTFTPNRVALLTAAAVLLLGVTLFFVLTGNDGETNPTPGLTRIPSEPNSEPGRVGPAPTNTIVATLTNERDAVWDHRPGEDLYAGQRLTLTQGYAEITTHRGAIAILEAPATIELLNNDNAIRLHTGRLVGICETESSKGFLVRTPQMDITDIGTRFGVDATDKHTDVHVFEGEVQVSHPDVADDTQSVTLAASQSARMASGTRLIQSIDNDLDTFAALLPQTIHKLTGTGHGLEIGEIDPNWQIIAINGDPITESGHLTVHKPTPFIALKSPLANDPESSQWLIVSRKFEESTWPECRYTIRTQFDLPAEIDPASARLKLRFDAEQRIELIRINGQAFDAPENSIDDDRNELNAMTITDAIVEGQNIVEFEVVDVSRNIGGFTWGLRVDWELQKWPGDSP